VPIRNMRRQHGRTWADYNRGCRCDECLRFASDYQRERRSAQTGSDTPVRTISARVVAMRGTQWTDDMAVRNRCPSLSPGRHPRPLENEPVRLRCAREAGHTGVHSMIVLRPYGGHEQIDWGTA
jgi:hypothetical protein